MSSEEVPKILFDYKNPSNVEAEVPGAQNMREVDENNKGIGDESAEDVANVSSELVDSGGFTFEPVITITKKEATFTKGDLKLQSIKVEEIQNGGSQQLLKRFYSETRSETIHGAEITKTTVRLSSSKDEHVDFKEVIPIDERKRKTKIPKLKFRQTVEKVKAERKLARENENDEPPKSKINRRSKISPPSTKPIVTKRNSALMDDEFDKIYEDLLDDVDNFDDNILVNNIEDPDKVEIKFEELIHEYDKNKIQSNNVEKASQSKIPFRRRRSEQDGELDKILSQKDDNHKKHKVGSSIPLLRRRSVHDNEKSNDTSKNYKDSNEKEENTKINSSIPLLRRKSGQDGDISKSTYIKTEKHGVVAETLTTITKSMPVSQITLQTDFAVSVKNENKISNELDQYNNTEVTSKDCLDKGKVKTSIPRLIDNRPDGRKVIRTYTRTVTTEKIVPGKVNYDADSNKEEKLNCHSNFETNGTSTIRESAFEAKSNTENSTFGTMEVENIIKDSVKIGIPLFESQSESKDNDQTVEITKILEWKINTDHNIDKKNIKCKAKYDTSEIKCIESSDENNTTIEPNIVRDNLNNVEALTEIESNIIDQKTSTVQNSLISREFNSNSNKGYTKDKRSIFTNKIDTITTTTTEKQFSSQSQTVTEITDQQQSDKKEREGSRFNRVSSLTILKGIDYDEDLMSPQLLSNKSPTLDVGNIKTAFSVEDTKKVSEVLKSPKVDKDGNADLLPEYNIRIKRLSKEMKLTDDTLKKWNKDLNSPVGDKPLEIDNTISTKNTDYKTDTTDMDKARNLLSRVLDRDRRTEYRTSKLEPNKNAVLDELSENKNHITNRDNKIKNNIELKKSLEPSNTRGEAKLLSKSMENYNHERQYMTKIVKENKRDGLFEELGVKGKVGQLINKIDSKELITDSIKKEVSRRSVLSKVAMFERQETLDAVKARRPQHETKLSKLTIKESQGSTHVHIHTPMIVEEVLKGADWDLKHQEGSSNKVVIPWNINFDKIILDSKDSKAKLADEIIKTESVEEIPQGEPVREGTNSSDKHVKNSALSNLEEENKTDFEFEGVIVRENTVTPIKDKEEFTIQIDEDYNTVNLIKNNESNVDVEILTNTLKVEPVTVRDIATSPIRLSLDAKSFDITQNQVLSDAPVIIVHPKINYHLSKSTEAIYTTQPEMNNNNTSNKKINPTTSTSKLYPEKVKANIKLYESIGNKSNKNKSDRVFERASSASIFESYKNERYSKTNRLRRSYTPQNSFNMESSETTIMQDHKHRRISVDGSKIYRAGDKFTHAYEYGSLQLTNETTDKESIKKESTDNLAIREVNKSKNNTICSDKKNTVESNSFESIQMFNKSEIKHEHKNEPFKIEAVSVKSDKIIPIAYELSKNGNNDEKVITKHEHIIREEDGIMAKQPLSGTNLDDAVKGKVNKTLNRMAAFDKYQKKPPIKVKEMPRKTSVLEMVALFERKAVGKQIKAETIATQLEDDSKRIEELQNAKTKYGTVNQMPTFVLNNGQKMPVLAIGTATLVPKLVKHVVSAAIDLGYRAIDTAYIYGNEKEIGEAIRAKIDDGTVKREELFIMSKLWSTFHRTDLVQTACENSLKTMGLTYFDLYMIHNPMSLKEGAEPLPKMGTTLQYSNNEYMDAWYGMEKLLKKGLVKGIGLSNFNSIQIERIIKKGKIRPLVNQVECHPYLSQRRLHNFCIERQIRLTCFGTLGSKGTPGDFKTDLSPVIDDPLVKVMASGLNVTPAQLLIRYQLECERGVIVKSSSAAHLWDNLNTLNFTLTHGQVHALHALNRNERIFTFKGFGETHKNYPFSIAF